MSDDTKNIAELDLLRCQRAQLASRLTTPWWYVAAFAVGMALACAVPFAIHYAHGTGAWCGLLSCVVICYLQHALTQKSGVDIGTRTLRYPSGRGWEIALIPVFLVALAAEALLIRHGWPAAAIAVGVLASLAGTGCWQVRLRGIRRDLETGKGAM